MRCLRGRKLQALCIMFLTMVTIVYLHGCRSTVSNRAKRTLLYKKTNLINNVSVILPCEDSTTMASESVLLNRGIVSSSGDYIYHPHAYPSAPSGNAESSVCLATFTSVSRLFWLPWLLESWSGPVSVAVYSPGRDYAALTLVLKFLRMCFPDVEKRVSFHLLYPVKVKPSFAQEQIDISTLDCNDPESSIENIIKALLIYKKKMASKFPQNHLRNLARRSCPTNFSLVTDIDMIPSPFMYDKMDPLLRSSIECTKCALVIPVYEIASTETHLPTTKESLLEYLVDKKAQRYHIQVYEKNQGNSKLDFWEESYITNNTKKLVWSLVDGVYNNQSSIKALRNYKDVPYRELHKIKSFEEFWEPITVLPRDAPGYDERFVGFGFCRSSLTYELHMRGYSFRLLNEPFLSHWGFQTSNHYPKNRILENKENFIRYEAFKRELSARYMIPTAAGLRRLPGHKFRPFVIRGGRRWRVVVRRAAMDGRREEGGDEGLS